MTQAMSDPPRHYSFRNVRRHIHIYGDNKGRGRWWYRDADLILEPGESAWNPKSGSMPIRGPAILTYKRFADGDVECQVERE